MILDKYFYPIFLDNKMTAIYWKLIYINRDREIEI